MTTPEFYFDQKRQLLIYRNASQFLTDQLRQAIPEAREINGSYLVVPRNLRNSQVLRHFQFPVAPVITDSNYQWPRHPSIGHPYESQKLTTNFMILHPRCFVLSDMGVGKTLSTLWAADAVMRMHKPGTCRALIVCPLSIMQRVWSDAVFKNFLGARTVEILHGDANARLKALARPADLYIINFDGVGVGAHTRKKFELDGFSKELAARDDIRICIVDEASAYKDATTKRHRIARAVFGKKDYLWLLSGTPVPNAPTDAYGLAKLVNNANGQSFQSFKMSTMYQLAPNSFKWLPRRDGYEKARALLKPSIRFSIDQVWDAPPMTTQLREVELTAEQKKLMADLKKDFVITVKSGAAISAVNEAAARIKFVQISLGAIYDQSHRVHAIDAGPRYAELIDVLEQAPGKTICFSPLTSVINMIYKNINKRWPSAVVNGDVSQKERSNIFQAFQDLENPLRVLVADPQTMAHGLDLYAARAVVWFGPSEKAELYAQANARMHRPGQRFPTTVVQLVSNPLEREIFRRLENNIALQGTLLQAVKENWI